ncbi:pyridoxamine 5'-phosphate oxidase family protein [Microbacterium esteraromaticum]|uniref:pyridoxamine 5'-phosphate oxidase family protein n=1 Tax=Microbacterium esteraromaticum TaxID=57043 RepID=UPI0019D39EAA|nr:pyridoxamine 5'-phosphate oxidase family protein [Microbacterium esteraromaticum]MBN7792125.1 pyridoxamine 5'-phosphate oxidase family protein [Microbacterium esteraromaticum]MBN8422952.1 pyridoxamine 5'-phosphate oxidase family protein [Microbacterium esteraromaticum]MBY6062355.1 pyridoxamine 5'-phosphate oxidase family protein [Microbacterium esteraromaticum]WDH77780.1 pyridoxamine 5'-phosphate oxidase family protein [Microbacterium esteraromaticum]
MSIDAADRAAVAHFVRVCGSGVVATVGEQGEPQAAYVVMYAGDDAVLVFDAAVDSRKVANIARDPRIAVAVTGAAVTVQLEGEARATQGAERARLGEEYCRHFPSSRALDDGYALFAVDVRWVRVYDTGSHPPHVSEARWGS